MRPILCVLLVLATCLVVSRPVTAQEQEEEESIRRSRIGLSVPREIRRKKRRAAKQGEWVWSVAAAASAGYDSNTHRAPSGEEHSAFFDVDARGEVLHYFNPDDRIHIRAEASTVPYTATSDVDDYSQQVGIFYGHRFNRDLSFSLKGKVKHRNDSATNTLGQKFTRDFESWTYRVIPTLRWEFTRDHTLTIDYSVKRKDYDEVATLNSLDWFSHAPTIEYEWEISRALDWSLEYRFTHQIYDSEPASLSNGTESAANPDEEHQFHIVTTRLDWEPRGWLALHSDFQWRHKEDTFRNFESYDAYELECRVDVLVGDVTLMTELSYEHRDYDNRPDSAGGTLEYDRVEASLHARMQLSDYIGLFGGYGLTWRDTDRSAGTTYRSFVQHTLTAGVSFAY